MQIVMSTGLNLPPVQLPLVTPWLMTHSVQKMVIKLTANSLQKTSVTR